jgi:hypothetical protein
LAHAQEVGAGESIAQAIGLQIEAMAKARQGVFTFGKNEEKISTGFHLLVHGSFPVGALDTNGF